MLVRLGQHAHILLLGMHHIVSDGWSMGVLINELTALYAAFHQGSASPLLPLPIQYADFARWQREWLQGEVLDHQLAYWRKQLSDISGPLRLPVDNHRLDKASFHAATEPFSLPADSAQLLKRLCGEHGA